MAEPSFNYQWVSKDDLDELERVFKLPAGTFDRNVISRIRVVWEACAVFGFAVTFIVLGLWMATKGSALGALGLIALGIVFGSLPALLVRWTR